MRFNELDYLVSINRSINELWNIVEEMIDQPGCNHRDQALLVLQSMKHNLLNVICDVYDGK